ncbi:MAG: aspartyl-phosphate phosphatase Spo0E family protein [Eubacteriales bacterium]|jgi:hypothetical protein|nr:aspartyl-phosphate phosphatase Spo0E family protein [Clostridia bacterium]MDI9512703.1 aspartyl-phosphate phosphatase Spo0E family protein [Bacillota bacterium]
MTVETIKLKIRSKQDELNKLTLECETLTSKDVLALSRQLDELIVKYIKLKKNKKQYQ